ncbi:MAG: FHA domain-containing protein [Solirubrobacteraceae bacterium]
MDLLFEIVEGPGAGRQIALTGPIVLGRDQSADIVLDDGQISRRHARVTPSARGAVVEDLESTNGTFVNHDEVHAPIELAPGDQILVGVTVLQLRSPEQVRAQASAVRAVPPGLATPERRPAYVDAGPGQVARAGQGAGIPELDRLVDSRVKSKATLAPLAIFVLAALVVVIDLGLVR